MKLTNLVFPVALAVAFASCNKEEQEPELVLPSGLTTQINQTDFNVNVTVSAENANFYTVVFYDSDDTVVVESSIGEASYTFSSNGSYTIESRANATTDKYVSRTDIVTINVDQSGTTGAPTTGYSTPLSYAGYTLVWNDEFDGTTLSSDWVHEIGNGQAQGIPGWGNNELQYYRSENMTVQDGYAIITAKQESYGGFNYTSSRVKTQGAQSFEKGRIDIRAALPYSKGLWPALWMLGDNITTDGWPACGEIDIMELVGGTDNQVLGTAHWDNGGSYASFSGNTTLASGIFADEFHVFSIIWDNNQIRWLMDDVQYHALSITDAEMQEFHQNFFFIMNVAVGGTLPGNPDQTSVFPQSMYVDYIRVFQ